MRTALWVHGILTLKAKQMVIQRLVMTTGVCLINKIMTINLAPLIGLFIRSTMVIQAAMAKHGILE